MIEQNCQTFDLTDKHEKINFDAFSEEQLRKIVQYINSGVEIRKEEAILFSDYMLEESEWWSRKSAKYIEIPFGVAAFARLHFVRYRVHLISYPRE